MILILYRSYTDSRVCMYVFLIKKYFEHIKLLLKCIVLETYVLDYELLLTCKISKKGIFFHKSKTKNFFLFFMGDESPNAHESKSMIGFVPSCSTAEITVNQSSKLSKLRSTFERVPLNFFNCSG